MLFLVPVETPTFLPFYLSKFWKLFVSIWKVFIHFFNIFVWSFRCIWNYCNVIMGLQGNNKKVFLHNDETLKALDIKLWNISCFVKYCCWYHVLCQTIHLYVCKRVCTDYFFIYLINQITLSVRIENVTVYCYDWAGQNVQWGVSAMRKIQYLDVGYFKKNNILQIYCIDCIGQTV